MVAREIGIDDTLTARLAFRRPSLGFVSPGFWRVRAQEPTDGLGIELLLAAEVPIEAAARQSGIFHDLLDRHLRESPSIEEASRTFQDSPPCIVLVLPRVGHAVLLCDSSHCGTLWILSCIRLSGRSQGVAGWC